MSRLTILTVINILISVLLSLKIINSNQKLENTSIDLIKDWIYNYSQNYLFLENNYLFLVKKNNLLWKTKIDNSNYSILEIDKENLIILLSNNNIKLLSLKNGKIIWERKIDNYNYKLPSLNDKNIFLLGDNKIYFINKKSGNIDKIVSLNKDLTSKNNNNMSKKKEVSVKIVYLKPDKKYKDNKKYFFSLYRLNIKGKLKNNFLLEKLKKDEYFHKSDSFSIYKENIFNLNDIDNKIFNLNKIIGYVNNSILYKRNSKVYLFDIQKNVELLLSNEDIQNIYISNDNKYILFSKHKIICKKINNKLWEYNLENYIETLKFYKNNIIFNDGLYKLKSLDINTGKLNWTFNSSSIIFSFFISENNLYLTTSLADLKSKNYIYQININTGEFNWSFEFPEDEWFYSVIEKYNSIFIVNTKSITTSW